MNELKKYYYQVDEFVAYLKDLVIDTDFLIISDHGWDFTKNLHSDYGFISSNKEMNFPATIIELGKQIKTISEEKMK